MSLVLWIHAAATWFLVGVIWFVQIVHYPSFPRVGGTPGVGRGGFAEYEWANIRRTAWLVGPVMVVEALAALAILAVPPEGVPRSAAAAGLLAIVVVWISRFCVQPPMFRRNS